MMVVPFHDILYEKNMKNLQTNIYLAFFLDFEYLVPSQSYKIFIRISSEKTYCIDYFKKLNVNKSQVYRAITCVKAGHFHLRPDGSSSPIKLIR